MVLELVAHHAPQELRGAQAKTLGRLGRHVDVAGLGANVHDGVGQRHGGLAIHRRMVQLGVERHAARAVGAGAQALDDVELPQGAAAVEQLGVELAHQGLERRVFVGSAGRARQGGQLDGDDVGFQVRHGAHPGGVGQVHGQRGQLAAQAGGDGQAALDVAAQRGAEAPLEAGRQLELVQGAHVHGHLGGFKVQKGGVEGRELFHAAWTGRS